MSEWKQILIENLVLAADIGLTVLFYKFYKDRCTTADQVADLAPFNLSDPSLLANGSIDYGLVEGLVYPIQDSLKSEFAEAEGPIKYFKRVLHKSERNRGYWTDRNTVLSENYDKVAFALFDTERINRILVTEPRSADYLQQALHTTHDQFEPYARSLSENIFDRIVGEITKGYQTTEQILKSGTAMLGLGKIVLTNGSLQLHKPTAPGSRYILTSMSKSELIADLKSRATVFKIMAGIFGCAGVVILWVTAGHRFREWREHVRSQAAMSEIREQLARMRAVNSATNEAVTLPESSPTAENNSCVICLTNSRDIAIRPCGHVCTCIRCYEAIPGPKLCPVCRSPVESIIPIFIP